MTTEQYRKTWLRLYDKYERKGIAMFRRSLRDTVNKIPFENLEPWNYKVITEMNINAKELEKAYFKLYSTIGIAHGKRVGKSLPRQKNFDPSAFTNTFLEFIRMWLLEYAGTKIVSVNDEIKDYIINYISDGLNDNKDIRTLSRELQKHINSRSFYRWQILRIVRTETTAAANLGAIQAGNSSGVIWEKRWISAQDARTRRPPKGIYDHYSMNGVKVLKGEKFNVQGDMIDFPGDPRGHAGNIINCRCTVAIVAKRDSRGNIIFV